ncbi:hypothetical protein GGR53DRAFT_513551 [Hypoxylon sp. FL1150]|nr:hypothetical protein GGR53DRAFT_513551 [Hypoxylon sp. FL1150]
MRSFVTALAIAASLQGGSAAPVAGEQHHGTKTLSSFSTGGLPPPTGLPHPTGGLQRPGGAAPWVRDTEHKGHAHPTGHHKGKHHTGKHTGHHSSGHAKPTGHHKHERGEDHEHPPPFPTGTGPHGGHPHPTGGFPHPTGGHHKHSGGHAKPTGGNHKQERAEDHQHPPPFPTGTGPHGGHPHPTGGVPHPTGGVPHPTGGHHGGGKHGKGQQGSTTATTTTTSSAAAQTTGGDAQKRAEENVARKAPEGNDKNDVTLNQVYDLARKLPQPTGGKKPFKSNVLAVLKSEKAKGTKVDGKPAEDTIKDIKDGKIKG